MNNIANLMVKMKMYPKLFNFVSNYFNKTFVEKITRSF